MDRADREVLSDGQAQSRALKDFKESLKAEQMQQYAVLNLPKWVPKNAFVGSKERMHLYPKKLLWTIFGALC